MELNLNNRLALVTGSSRGTGQVIAETLLREGATVIFHALEQHDAPDVAKRANCYSCWGDITSEAGRAQLVEQISTIGEIDILVNNYGTGSAGKWASCSEEDWLIMYQHNVLSAAGLCRAFSPAMRRKGWGRIVQLGTIGSHQPNNIMPHYYAAKGALATMTVSLTKELSGSGVTVNTVSPGLIHTAELEQSYRRRAAKLGWGERWEDIVAGIVSRDFPNPCERIADRQEVADLVAYLCSDLAGFINGQNIRIDGGAVRYV